MKLRTKLFGEIIGICLISLGVAKSQIVSMNGITLFIKPLYYILPTLLTLLGAINYYNFRRLKCKN